MTTNSAWENTHLAALELRADEAVAFRGEEEHIACKIVRWRQS
ncbi:MAG: hypothetical protein R3A10_11585 [Caldilineaceae bacterium]